MFSTLSRSALRARSALSQTAVEAAACPAAPFIASRGMAVSLADLRKRILATNNVAQLTGVMKLVAASKLKGVETRLEQGRPYGQGLADSISFKEQTLDDDDEGVDAANRATQLAEANAADAADGKKHMFLVITTDRGLCGGVNTQVTRAVRANVQAKLNAGVDIKLFVCGEKGKGQLSRGYADQMVRTIDSAFDKDITFALAAAIAERVVAEDFDVLTLWYNEYVSPAKFALTQRAVPRIAGLPVGTRPPLFHDYAVEPEDNEEALANMEEYAIAGSIYGALLESQCCEMASRMTAMDNATNNATEMVSAFTLQYNRARQAKITTELVEIISGAEALEDGNADE